MKCITPYCLLLLLFSGTVQAQDMFDDTFRVHGLSAFKAEQKKMLSQWLTRGVNGTRATLGVYPRRLELYVYAKKSNQPVPWAHTRRDQKESIHFYVDSRFSLDKFINDWTIYHEMSHLALPYLGPEYAWFSEGFASFMQYQIMAKTGVLKGTLEQRYQQKIGPHLKWFNSDLSAASIARRLLSNRNFPAGYWGAAWFFIVADQQLRQKHNVSLNTVVEHYQACCRLRDNTVQEVLQSFDRLIEDTLFSDLLKRFENDAARTLYPREFSN
ncbi:MAG: hypothetical protein ACI8Z9_001199 [Paraglaciecola sp.]|jgi:hypothetical protein